MKKLAAGNWKMNLSLEEGYGLATEIKGMVADEINNSQVDIVLIPSFLHLYGIKSLLKTSFRCSKDWNLFMIIIIYLN